MRVTSTTASKTALLKGLTMLEVNITKIVQLSGQDGWDTVYFTLGSASDREAFSAVRNTVTGKIDAGSYEEECADWAWAAVCLLEEIINAAAREWVAAHGVEVAQ